MELFIYRYWFLRSALLFNEQYPNILAQNNSQGSGATAFSVLAGDTFGFRVYSLDSTFGAGVAVISNFSAPVPGPLPLLGTAAAYSFSRRLRQRTRLGSRPQA